MPPSRRVFNASVLRGNWTGVEKAVCAFAFELYTKYSHDGGIVFLVPPGVVIPGIPEDFLYRLPWFTRFRAGRILYELFFMSRLVRTLGASCFYGPAYLLPPGIKCQTTLFVYDLHVYSCPRYCKLFNVVHYRLRMPSSIRRADRIIVPTSRVADVLASRFPVAADKTEIVSIPLASVFSGAKEVDDGLHRQISEKWNRYFLAVGAPAPRKNHKSVIEAWRNLPKPRPALLITGGKERKAANDDEPEFLGYVSDEMMAALYSGAMALVYPSFDEGYGLPVAEAIAVGTKVITTAQIAESFNSELIYFCGTDSASIGVAMKSLCSL